MTGRRGRRPRVRGGAPPGRTGRGRRRRRSSDLLVKLGLGRRWGGDAEGVDPAAAADWVARGARYVGGCCRVTASRSRSSCTRATRHWTSAAQPAGRRAVALFWPGAGELAERRAAVAATAHVAAARGAAPAAGRPRRAVAGVAVRDRATPRSCARARHQPVGSFAGRRRGPRRSSRRSPRRPTPARPSRPWRARARCMTSLAFPRRCSPGAWSRFQTSRRGCVAPVIWMKWPTSRRARHCSTRWRPR